MRGLLLAIGVVFAVSTDVQAQSTTSSDVIRDVRTSITLNLLSAERIFLGVDHALDTAGFVMKTTGNTRVVHEEFRAISDRLPGVRAIIAIGPDGSLVIDSYQHPAPEVKLGDREYVKEARSKPGLYIGSAQIGRTSGIPFLPASKLVGEHVIAAIISPHFLIHEEGRCGDCVSAILREDGSMIASFPPAAELPPNVLSLPLINKNLEGNATSLFNRTESVIAWRRSEIFPVIVLGAKGLRSAAPIGVDDR